MDPFLDLVRLLRPRATLWSELEAAGRWGVSFRQRDDLLFCWVAQGECQLLRPGAEPLALRRDDFVLVRTVTSFTLTSDPTMKPLDSEALVASTRDHRLKLGQDTDAPFGLRGGKFVFDSANEDLLTGLLPPILHVAGDDSSSAAVRSLLKMNETESREPGPGSAFVIARLMELILVEMLRRRPSSVTAPSAGLIAGLADPVTARALSAMHGDVARDWTVATLARLSGVSRSAFAARFREVVGVGPIEYLLQWRMALAKDEVRRGTRSVGEIALGVGFQSTSAFSTAFTRAVGCSPKAFAKLGSSRAAP